MLEEPVAQAKLVIPSRLEHLPRVRELIENAAEDAGFPPQEVQRIVTAAFEAVVNAATHGSPHGPQNSIIVVVCIYKDRMVIEVTDEGSGFADTSPPMMPDTSSRRGRGLPLMRVLSDVVELSNNGGGKVTLTYYKEGVERSSDER